MGKGGRDQANVINRSDQQWHSGVRACVCVCEWSVWVYNTTIVWLYLCIHTHRVRAHCIVSILCRFGVGKAYAIAFNADMIYYISVIQILADKRPIKMIHIQCSVFSIQCSGVQCSCVRGVPMQAALATA